MVNRISRRNKEQQWINGTKPVARLAPLDAEHTPELKEHFETARKRMGFVPNSMLIMQRSPKMVRGFTQMSAAIWDPEGKVDLKLKRLISHVASRSAGCKYCMAHTAEGAAKLGVDQQKLDAVWDYQISPLYNAAERAALDVAIAAGCVPNAVTDEMFSELRKHWTTIRSLRLLVSLRCLVSSIAGTIPSRRHSRMNLSNLARNISRHGDGTLANIDANHLGLVRLVSIALKVLAVWLAFGTSAVADWHVQVLATPGRVQAVESVNGEARVAVGRSWYRINATNLKLERSSPPPRIKPPAGALADGRVVVGSNRIARSWLAGPTTRYGHGVLGDATEADAIVVERANGRATLFVSAMMQSSKTSRRVLL